MMTPKTREKIRQIEDEIATERSAVVQREISNATTAHEAIKALLDWSSALGLRINPSNYSFDGRTFPNHFEPATQWLVNIGSNHTANTRALLTDGLTGYSARSTTTDTIPVGLWSKTLFVYNFTLMGTSTSQMKKIVKWLEDNDKSDQYSRVAFIASYPSAEQVYWLGADNLVDYATIKDVKLPSAKAATKNTTGRLAGSYDLFEAGTYRDGVDGATIDTSKRIFYVHGNYNTAHRFVKILTETFPDCYIVALSANRIEKFKRILPAAKTAKEGVRELWEAAAAQFTDEQKLALYIQDDSGFRGTTLEGESFDDPAINEAIRLSNLDVSAVRQTREKFARVVDTEALMRVQWSDPMAKYPLFEATYRSYYYNGRDGFTADLVLYINSKYNATKGA